MTQTSRGDSHLFLYGNTFVIVLLGASLAGWGVFWSFPANLGEGYHNVQALVLEVRKVLFWRVAILYAAISFLILLAMAVLHLFYSHRIAGPTYRIGKEAARIAQGNLAGTIKFRRKDNLTDMAESLNEMTSRYRGRIDAIKTSLADIDARSQLVSEFIHQGKGGVALKQAAEEITSDVGNIERSLSEIKT
jgi:methyl-accepting chemotaxis protein